MQEEMTFCVANMLHALHIKRRCGEVFLVVKNEGIVRLTREEVGEIFSDNPRVKDIAADIANKDAVAMKIAGTNAIEKLIGILQDNPLGGKPTLDTDEHFGCYIGYVPKTKQQAEFGLRYLLNNSGQKTTQLRAASTNRPGNHKDFPRRRKS